MLMTSKVVTTVILRHVIILATFVVAAVRFLDTTMMLKVAIAATLRHVVILTLTVTLNIFLSWTRPLVE